MHIRSAGISPGHLRIHTQGHPDPRRSRRSRCHRPPHPPSGRRLHCKPALLRHCQGQNHFGCPCIPAGCQPPGLRLQNQRHRCQRDLRGRNETHEFRRTGQHPGGQNRQGQGQLPRRAQPERLRQRRYHRNHPETYSGRRLLRQRLRHGRLCQFSRPATAQPASTTASLSTAEQ